MTRSVIVIINGKERILSPGPRPLLQVREVDYLQFRVHTDESDAPVELLIGDHRTDFCRVLINGQAWWETISKTYVSECFGHAVVNIVFPDEVERVDLDVLADKTTVEQARKMIAYLAEKNENLIASCFARSTYPTGSIRSGETPPETLLSAAEKLLMHLQERRSELLHHLRERLIPQRMPLWQRNSVNSVEIDPTDVITNLDALVPTAGAGDVFLRGRHYNLSNIDVAQLQSTHDVAENKILIGGLYSIRRKVADLQDELRAYEDKFIIGDTGNFESLSRLMLSLTATAMLRRCAIILHDVAGFIRLFHQHGVTYNGEMAPVMTAYARNTRVYRDLYSHLVRWYDLGSPWLDGINFLLKLRSLHTIFEIFTLFHLIEEITRQGWNGEHLVVREDYGSEIPASITFSLGADRLTLQYEPVISPLSKNSSHMDLVDVSHMPNDNYPYWTPDFVLRFSRGDAVRYLILDAKYSRRGTVRKYGLPDIVDKYFRCTAVYDAVNGILVSEHITGVFAIFALGEQGSHYLNMWNGNGPLESIVRLPMAGGIGLMIDNDVTFSRYIAAAMATTRRTLNKREISSAAGVE